VFSVRSNAPHPVSEAEGVPIVACTKRKHILSEQSGGKFERVWLVSMLIREDAIEFGEGCMVLQVFGFAMQDQS
jgi:hypothetical protein